MTPVKRLLEVSPRRRHPRATGVHLPSFHFAGGCLCLDFANTRGWRPSTRPTERLGSDADVIRWAEAAGLLAGHRNGRGHRPATAGLLRRALTIREAIYGLFAGIATGASVEGAAVARLHARLAELLPAGRLVPRGGWLAEWSEDSPVASRILGPVLQSAIRLLSSPDLQYVRTCAAPNCGWVFVDTTRNRSRRWCAMGVCGNRAKVRRYQAGLRRAQRRVSGRQGRTRATQRRDGVPRRSPARGP